MSKIGLYFFFGISELLFRLFPACNAQNVIMADKYINNDLVATYYIKNDRVVKYIGYDNSLKSSEEISYKFDPNGKLLQVNFKGDNNVSGSTPELEKKYYNDWITQKDFLSKKIKIKIPLESINTDEVSNISYFFSSAEKYTDTAIGNSRVLSIKNIDKKYRFYPSDLETFITIDNVIKEYIIKAENGTVNKEEIFFDTGVLTRTYYWQDATTLVVRIKCVYDNNEQIEQLKKIVIKQ